MSESNNSPRFNTKDISIQEEPQATRFIRATHTDSTVRVYQAYNESIAELAVAAQSFEAPQKEGIWSSTRMTWIKPSKVWVAYRCGWTMLKDSNQSRVLALDLDRRKFEQILVQGEFFYRGEGNKKKGQKDPIVVQWDPERVLHAEASVDQVFTRSRKNVRSIQIGLRPPANECLLDKSVVKCITDVTQDFRNALNCLQQGRVEEAATFLWPDGQEETIVTVPSAIETRLEMTPSSLQNKNNATAEREESKKTATKKCAVVVLGCAANPPHPGHLHCLREAWSEAKELGYNVQFSTIAVAPNGYVRHKMMKTNDNDPSSSSSSWILDDDDTRLRVLEVTARAMDGMSSFGFQVPTKTFGSALECGRALRANDETIVIVVVGGDRFKWQHKRGHDDVITFGCARSKEQFTQLHLQHGIVWYPTRWHLMTPGSSSSGSSCGGAGPNTTSSTMVRSILTHADTSHAEKQEELQGLGYPEEAARLLLDYKRKVNA